MNGLPIRGRISVRNCLVRAPYSYAFVRLSRRFVVPGLPQGKMVGQGQFPRHLGADGSRRVPGLGGVISQQTPRAAVLAPDEQKRQAQRQRQRFDRSGPHQRPDQRCLERLVFVGAVGRLTDADYTGTGQACGKGHELGGRRGSGGETMTLRVNPSHGGRLFVWGGLRGGSRHHGARVDSDAIVVRHIIRSPERSGSC